MEMSSVEIKEEKDDIKPKTAKIEKFKQLMIKYARQQKMKKLMDQKKKENPMNNIQHDSPYVPSNNIVIDNFIKLGNIKNNDIVIDVGCGDGRILINVAKKIKCKCIGIEINKKLIDRGNALIKDENIGNLVKLYCMDFKSDECKAILKTANVVFLYLLPSIMGTVTQILSECLQPNTRVVSNIFDLCTNKFFVNKWFYPILGSELQFINGKVIVTDVHPVLLSEFKIENGFELIRVNNIDVDVVSEYEFERFKLMLHNYISEYNMNKNIQFDLVFKSNDIKKENLYKPDKIMEISQKHKNGSITSSDLKLYIFPLKNNNLGWICNHGYYRIKT